MTHSRLQHGFRYAEIRGLEAAPAPADLVALEMHSAVASTGTVTTSSPLLNKIQSACVWTARSNLMSIPTDCCQRDERRGWLGDAAIGAPINTHNHDMAAFYTAFADLMADDRGPDGSIPNWVPIFTASYPGHGAPNWMTAFPTIIHAVWRQSGDTQIIERHWTGLMAYLDWYERRLNTTAGDFAKDPFRLDPDTGTPESTQFPGDWCPPPQKAGQWWSPTLANSSVARMLGEVECGHIAPGFNTDAEYTSKPLSSAFAYLKDCKLVGEMAAAVGRAVPGQAGQPEALAALFNAAFFVAAREDSGRGSSDHGAGGAPPHYGTGFQSEQVWPLWLGAVPEAAKPGVVAFLGAALEKAGNHTDSGIVGLRYAWETLAEVGLADQALSQLLSTDYPSFGFAIGNPEPSNSIWELFDAHLEGPSMDSRNHVMYASPTIFIHHSVVGLAPAADPAALWIMRPRVVGVSSELTSAAATVATPRGKLSAGWTEVAAARGGWAAVTEVDVPVGMAVEVHLSLGRADWATPGSCEATEGGVVVWRAGGFVAGPAGIDGATAVMGPGIEQSIAVAVRHGRYTFRLRCHPSMYVVG